MLKRNALRLAFGISLPFAAWFTLGLPLDAAISSGIGWGGFLICCAAAAVAAIGALIHASPEWLAVPCDVGWASLLRCLLAWAAAVFAILFVAVGAGIALFLDTHEPEIFLLALVLPAVWMLPVAAPICGARFRATRGV